ncbi:MULTISPECIES: hypothetical protein [Micrococcaceae]|jgi:hypothetical protein|uniref:hypothetical protein n=1 Tax=Micrococcaceae TaxID=1268 RepID=UPI00031F2121|nr:MULTISPECIES: hypothetical protein [Micrococcaceae]
MSGEREMAGRALHEERRTLLDGLWMPDAPPWDEPPKEDKGRWRQYTDKTTT